MKTQFTNVYMQHQALMNSLELDNTVRTDYHPQNMLNESNVDW